MPGEVDIAVVGELLADRARAAMLMELLCGHPLAAGELARRAGVSPSGASNHLRRLVAGGLVVGTASGRGRFYRLATGDVADALEGLGRIAPEKRVRSLGEAQRHEAIARARTCYDHLAGRLGVQVTRALVEHRHLRETKDGFLLSSGGGAWFSDALDVDVEELRRSRRAFALRCLDLTERQPHLAGALGAAVAHAFLGKGYARRVAGSRALKVTTDGDAWLVMNGVRL